MKPHVALFFVLAVTGSCHYGVTDIAAVPDHPTYNRDIYPLFVDHCLVCHSVPANRDAPKTFRLDVYDDVGGLSGAMNMAAAALGDVQIGRMPPAAKNGEGVGPNGLAMLKKWVDDGAPQ